jgi:hypothetical protein
LNERRQWRYPNPGSAMFAAKRTTPPDNTN